MYNALLRTQQQQQQQQPVQGLVIDSSGDDVTATNLPGSEVGPHSVRTMRPPPVGTEPAAPLGVGVYPVVQPVPPHQMALSSVQLGYNGDYSDHGVGGIPMSYAIGVPQQQQQQQVMPQQQVPPDTSGSLGGYTTWVLNMPTAMQTIPAPAPASVATDSYGNPLIFSAPASTGAQHLPPVQHQATANVTRTIFVTGFPNDVRARELHNLLRFIPGYEASQMCERGGSPQGFALFSTPAQAWVALEIVTHLQFDNNIHLRCEMAHKDMYVKDGDPTIWRAAPFPQYVFALFRNPQAPQAGMSSIPPSALPSIANMSAQGGVGLPLHRQYELGPMPQGAAGMTAGMHLGITSAQGDPGVGYGSLMMTKGDQIPCNTLFIGNLSDHVCEDELLAIFQRQAGYRQLKLVRGPKQVSCFVEFEDVMSAASCHMLLQGAVLPSSDRGGIRIQFSKNPYGMRSPLLVNSTSRVMTLVPRQP